MGQVKGHGCRGGTDVHHGDDALQFVMSGLVEEVAKRDHTRRLTGEVHGKPRGAAAEYTSQRVQFPAAMAQVVPGYDEIGSIKGGAGCKQETILTIPEAMAGRLRQSHRLDGQHRHYRRTGCNRGWLDH